MCPTKQVECRTQNKEYFEKRPCKSIPGSRHTNILEREPNEKEQNQLYLYWTWRVRERKMPKNRIPKINHKKRRRKITPLP